MIQNKRALKSRLPAGGKSHLKPDRYGGKLLSLIFPVPVDFGRVHCCRGHFRCETGAVTRRDLQGHRLASFVI
jgi:hypothetical protein